MNWIICSKQCLTMISCWFDLDTFCNDNLVCLSLSLTYDYYFGNKDYYFTTSLHCFDICEKCEYKTYWHLSKSFDLDICLWPIHDILCPYVTYRLDKGLTCIYDHDFWHPRSKRVILFWHDTFHLWHQVNIIIMGIIWCGEHFWIHQYQF